MYPSIETQILQLILIILAIALPLFLAFRKGRKMSLVVNASKIIKDVSLSSLKHSFFVFIFVEVLVYGYIFLGGGSINGGIVEIFTIPYMALEYFLGLILGYIMYRLYKH
ncbi:MAG: hypothetical protein Q7R31_01335 [Candidatus Levybacteria bacterium]|nr:hypothetical protein [Candidatus Levybacteria bacterium]